MLVNIRRIIMTRWLFTSLAALSLLLFVAVCVLWVRSYRACDRFHYNRFTVSDGNTFRHLGWGASQSRGVPSLWISRATGTASERALVSQQRALESPQGQINWHAEHSRDHVPMSPEHWWSRLGFDVIYERTRRSK